MDFFKEFAGLTLSFSDWLYYWVANFSIIILIITWRVNTVGYLKLSLNSLLVWLTLKLGVAFFEITNFTKEILKITALIIFTFLWFWKVKKFRGIGLIPTFILMLPLITSTWYLVPEYKSFLIFSFKITANGFDNLKSLYYIVLNKFSLFLVFLIWFILEKKWWRYAILSPLILLGNQLINLLFFPHLVFDEFEISQSGNYLIVLALVLIGLAMIFDNQQRIETVIQQRYGQLEKSVNEKFSSREKRIEENKQRILSKRLDDEELNKIKKELEEELRKLN